jgi:hypothetical protein
MKKGLLATLTAVIALTVAVGTAQAVPISNLSGQSCGASEGTWHFINNQTGGAGPGTLTATWDSGGTVTTVTVGPSKVLGNTQHFDVVASGTLLSASTNLPGRLVLSDFSCGVEPPKCDPKTDPKCEEPPTPCDPKKETCD